MTENVDRKKGATFDIFDLPVLRWFTGGSIPRVQPITTQRHRRESVGMIFRELSVCLRRNFPMPEALDKIARRGTKAKFTPTPARLILSILLVSILLICLIALIMKFLFHQKMRVENYIQFPITLFISLVILMILNYKGDFMRHVAFILSREMKKGKSLSEAMESRSRYFSDFELKMVKTGERTGNPAGALERIARYNHFQNRLPWTPYLFYICFQTIVMIIILYFFMMMKIMPRFSSIFAQIGSGLPPFTRHFIGFFNFITANPLGVFLFLAMLGFFTYLLSKSTVEIFFFSGWYFGTVLLFLTIVLFYSFWILGAYAAASKMPFIHPIGLMQMPVMFLLIIGTVIVVLYFISNPCLGAKESRMGSFLFDLPYIRSYIHPFRFSEFLYALGVLIHAGQPLPEALKYAGEASGHKRIRREAEILSEQISKGISLPEALKQSRILTPRLRGFLGIAGGSSQLPDTCRELAEDQLELANYRAEKGKIYVRALVSLIMGLMILAICVAMYLPYFQITQVVLTHTD